MQFRVLELRNQQLKSLLLGKSDKFDNVMGEAACFRHGQRTNIPIAAANIAIVVITTTTRDSIELG